MSPKIGPPQSFASSVDNINSPVGDVVNCHHTMDSSEIEKQEETSSFAGRVNRSLGNLLGVKDGMNYSKFTGANV
jgi:hypothetical protein